jgi:dTDP-4-amino-4,6-dideoxygalactose transaminase
MQAAEKHGCERHVRDEKVIGSATEEIRNVRGTAVWRQRQQRQIPGGVVANWHVFELRFNGDRDGLVVHLDRSGIQTNVYYVVPHHLQPAFAYLGYRKGRLPHSEKLCAEAIALPLYPEMNEQIVHDVVKAIHEFA